MSSAHPNNYEISFADDDEGEVISFLCAIVLLSANEKIFFSSTF